MHYYPRTQHSGTPIYALTQIARAAPNSVIFFFFFLIVRFLRERESSELVGERERRERFTVREGNG